MLSPSTFAQTCLRLGFTEVVGVPDSILKAVGRELELAFGQDHRIVANEGSAVAHAIGVFAREKKPALVYMQNSGLGNALNPLISLAHQSVMGIPMVLLIGWRGEMQTDGSQIFDEPQHLPQGRITSSLLDLLGIPWHILDADSDAEAVVRNSMRTAAEIQGPTAILVRRDVFSASERGASVSKLPGLSREQAIRVALEALPLSVPVVAATGMIGREVYENSGIIERSGAGNLLVVGGMGHSSAIAGSIARKTEVRKVLCLDGDGSVLMHMGALPHVAGESGLIHVMLNNGVHDSVGGQKTIARSLDFDAISIGYGFSSYAMCTTSQEVSSAILAALNRTGSSFIEVTCNPGNRGNLGRPTESPKESFEAFASFLLGQKEQEVG